MSQFKRRTTEETDTKKCEKSIKNSNQSEEYCEKKREETNEKTLRRSSCSDRRGGRRGRRRRRESVASILSRRSVAFGFKRGEGENGTNGALAICYAVVETNENGPALIFFFCLLIIFII
jgi:hypothetical protein